MPASVREKTEYQKTYKRIDMQSPTKLLKPLPSTLNPKPPIMDFRTTNRLAFKEVKNDGRTKPCKLKEEYELLTGPFHSDSVYKVDFPVHKPLPVKLERPATQKVQQDLKFDPRTMYKDTFYAKEQRKLKPFQELPSFTYSVLYPDRGNPVDKVSVKNTVHSGEFAERPDTLAPKECTVKIGMEGEHEMVTTNRETFKKYSGFVKEQPVKSGSEWKPRPKFDCKTQAQDDFKGFGEKIPARRKPITPPPETIDLKVDNKRYFETTKGREHRVTWDKTKVYRPALQKMEEKYSEPKEKFETFSVMRADFKGYGDVRPTAIKPPDQTTVSNAKFYGDTSYKMQFPKYDKMEIKRYGDPYEQRYYVKPFTKFPEEPSTMRSDFKNHGELKPRAPIIPENKRHADGGEFYDETSYSAEFKPKELEPCTFVKLLGETDRDQFHKIVTDSITSRRIPFGKINGKKTGLAATF